jgi:hypothetical protein
MMRKYSIQDQIKEVHAKIHIRNQKGQHSNARILEKLRKEYNLK